MEKRFFVYGSLMRGLHNSHLLKSSSLLLPGARTQSTDYCLIDSGNGYPYACHAASLSPKFHRTALVGELYSATPAVEALLDELEEHPVWYKRELISIDGEAEQAWAYFLFDQGELDAISSGHGGDTLSSYREVEPLGDWRTYHALGGDTASSADGAAAKHGLTTWPSSRHTAAKDDDDNPNGVMHAVFSFGSNGVEQLRTRCRNDSIVGIPAVLPDAVRVFAGASQRWDGGAVASIIPCPGQSVHGNVAMLSASELNLLDFYERGGNPSPSGLSADPYEADGVYRRQDVRVRIEDSTKEEGVSWRDAVAYVKVSLDWIRPPSPAYVAACRRNVDEFWPELRDSPLEIRDGRGRLREER